MWREGKLLTPDKQDLFFRRCEAGKVYTYHDGFYLWRDIKRLAEKHGVAIKYCRSGSPEYEIFGCFNFKVIYNPNETKIVKEKEIKKEPVTFDVDNLVLN